jgi:glyoxylase-like metal-dependent hydrolase (beta-lactamase superfamily II)
VFIPEEKVLCVGDMIADGWLPPLSRNYDFDPDYLLKTWSEIIKNTSGIKYIITGHSYTEISVEVFIKRYQYFNTLWEGLISAKREGKTLEEAKTLFDIEKVFPEMKNDRRVLSDGTGKNYDVHISNIECLWSKIM